MALFDFPQTPDGKLDELWRAVLRLLPQLTRRVRRNVAIGTAETPVAHGMRFAPQMVMAMPMANVSVWETKAPDTKLVYLQAASAVTCSLEFVP